MKKHFLIGIIAFITFNCIGCSNENFTEDYPEDLKSNIPKEYEIIGEMHNQGLEYAFDSLRSYYMVKKVRSKHSTTKKLTHNEVQKLMSKAVLNFAERNDQRFLTKAVKSNSNEWNSNIPIDSLLQEKVILNENVTLFLEKIKNTLKQQPKSSEELLYKLNKINEEAQSVLSKQELVAIYAGTSTCYHSYKYWKDNYLKWELTLKHPNLAAKYTEEEINQLVMKNGKIMPLKNVRSEGKDKNWWDSITDWADESWDNICDDVSDWWEEGGEDVVAADAGDAVAGAIGGAIGGGSTTGGVGAVPGAITGAIAGGCMGSVSEAINQWIKN